MTILIVLVFLCKLNAATYRCFEAGTTINEIQEYLWPSEHRTTKHPEKYRVLENVTSGPGLSLAGMVSTGAHGNGNPGSVRRTYE
jgi:hypothetical protein